MPRGNGTPPPLCAPTLSQHIPDLAQRGMGSGVLLDDLAPGRIVCQQGRGGAYDMDLQRPLVGTQLCVQGWLEEREEGVSQQGRGGSYDVDLQRELRPWYPIARKRGEVHTRVKRDMQGQSRHKLGWLWSIYLLFLKPPQSSP